MGRMNRFVIAILCLMGLPLFLGAQVKTLDFSCNIHESDFSQGLKSDVYVISPDGTRITIPCQKESEKTIDSILSLRNMKFLSDNGENTIRGVRKKNKTIKIGFQRQDSDFFLY